MSTFSRGGRRTTRRGRTRGGRESSRRLVWDLNLFSANFLAANSTVELALLTQAALLESSLGIGTIVQIYGKVAIRASAGETNGDLAVGAWGIRVKEADAATSSTVFSPAFDSSSTNWITNRGFSVHYQTSDAVMLTDPLSQDITTFNVRNPRKFKPEDELVLTIENLVTSTATISYTVWCRVGILLP